MAASSTRRVKRGWSPDNLGTAFEPKLHPTPEKKRLHNWPSVGGSGQADCSSVRSLEINCISNGVCQDAFEVESAANGDGADSMELDVTSADGSHMALDDASDEETSSSPTFSVESNSTGVTSISSKYNGLLADQQDHSHVDEASQEICFGMICNVRVSFLDSLKLEDTNHVGLESVSKQDIHRLNLVWKKDNHITLRSKDGMDIATLHTKTAEGLQKLGDMAFIRYDTFVTVGEWLEHVMLWRTEGKRTNMTVNINVYGSASEFDAVGKRLSGASIYLQHPDHCDEQARYDNPHFFKLPLMELPTLEPSTAISSGADFIDLSSILDTLDRNDCLQQATIDPRVKTQLLPHQRKGVDFISQMEGLDNENSQILWQMHRDVDSCLFYQHKITDLRRSQVVYGPSGGIIADDMGLGKSLTVLSAIMSTLDFARSFGEANGSSYSRDHNSQGFRSKSTLIVVPSTLLLDGWEEEIHKHIVASALGFHKYHGSRRESDPQKIASYDIVFTTYATLVTEFVQGNSALHQVHWFRVVLDEAHVIRHQSTRQFRATLALSARHRWCLTGTPIQNSLNDLGSLVRFLRVPTLDSMPLFRKHVISPVKKDHSAGLQKLQLLLQSICLRRPKNLIKLPEPTVLYKYLRLSSAEVERYNSILTTFSEIVDDAANDNKSKKSTNVAFQALNRLRLLCDRGTLEQVTVDSMGQSDAEDTLAQLREIDQANCHYCSEDIISISPSENATGSAYLTNCLRLVCMECLDEYIDLCKQLQHSEEIVCPLCEKTLSCCDLPNARGRGRKGQVQKEQAGHLPITGGYSSKLEALLQDIEDNRFGTKNIVFSVWKKVLDLVSAIFTAKEIPFLRIDGSLSLAERRRVLKSFREDSGIPVLLMTLGTGAVGLTRLNLTVANRIHILEPQWNPSVESQAIGRAVRFGQERTVTVVRYIMNDTVEEAIANMQSRKRRLATIGWNQESDSPHDQALDDLKELQPLSYAEPDLPNGMVADPYRKQVPVW